MPTTGSSIGSLIDTFLARGADIRAVFLVTSVLWIQQIYLERIPSPELTKGSVHVKFTYAHGGL